MDKEILERANEIEKAINNLIAKRLDAENTIDRYLKYICCNNDCRIIVNVYNFNDPELRFNLFDEFIDLRKVFEYQKGAIQLKIEKLEEEFKAL